MEVRTISGRCTSSSPTLQYFCNVLNEIMDTLLFSEISYILQHFKLSNKITSHSCGDCEASLRNEDPPTEVEHQCN